MADIVRCRFAPSPTGELHLGSARTALFNYLYARANQGSYLLRIEDTDRERSTPEAVETILTSLEWLGLTPDEEPLYQSTRTRIYQQYVQKLLTSGDAYPCYCSVEELEQMRVSAREEKRKRVYNGKYRPDSKTPADTTLPSTENPFVVRLRVPEGQQTTFQDIIVGGVVTNNEEIDDFILLRSDGSPTYNLTVVVDDYDTRITHVIRGMDHISNTAKQLLIYQALGLEAPLFAHVPMILGEDKKKLSKRHGATAVIDYKRQGYLPDAFLNQLARLGWGHGDQEIFTRAELEQLFRLDKVGKGDAVFDFAKFNSVNAEHIKRTPASTLREALRAFLPEAFSKSEKLEVPTFLELIELLKERSQTLVEMEESCRWYFYPAEEVPYDEKATKKFLKEDALERLSRLSEKLETLEYFDESSLERVFTELQKELEVGFGKLAQPLRVALTGTASSPPIYSVLRILGKSESLQRIRLAQTFGTEDSHSS